MIVFIEMKNHNDRPKILEFIHPYRHTYIDIDYRITDRALPSGLVIQF